MALAALLGLALASAALASSAPVPGWGSKGEIAYKCGNDALCLVRQDLSQRPTQRGSQRQPGPTPALWELGGV